MRFKVGAATSIGRVRPINEDAYLVQEDGGLFVVCDGMGGAAAGEVASQLAVETIGAFVRNGALGKGTQRGFQPRTNGLGRAVEEANRAILERAQAESATAGMGTTVVAIWIGDGLASIAHVGDSRLYARNASGFEALTSDHSLVEMQVKAGQLTREQALKSEQQNILLRALGRDADVDVEVNEVPIQAGDYLLLCSDGLTRMVDDNIMGEIVADVRDPGQICETLIEVANLNGGADNVTVVVVEVIGGWWRELVNRVQRSLRRPRWRR